MRKLLLILGVLFSQELSAQSIQVKISGKIQDFDEKSLVLQKASINGRSLTAVDTLAVVNGQFEKLCILPEHGLYVFRIKRAGIVMALENKESVEIEVTEENTKIGGTSKGSLLIKEYADFEVSLTQKYLKPVEQAYMEAQGDETKEAGLIKAYEKALKDKDKELNQMVLDKFESSIALHYVALKWDGNTDLALMEEINKRVQKKHPKTTFAEFVNQRYKSLSQIVMGAIAPEIDLADVDGKNIKLSSFKGKYVLIDFWAAWCGPCRAENPNVVRMYGEYKSKGLEIYGVSLDDSKQAWLKAIEKDKLTWINVSDLKGWQSIAAKTYSVSAIPMSFLLDKQGKIIAKNLRGKALEDKLKELMP